KVGKSIDYMKSQAIPLEDVEATLADQKSSIRPCDILLLRTGWIDFYINRATRAQKESLAKDSIVPGIEGSQRVAKWLWDHRVVAVAADSPALENLPKSEGEEFMHFHMLALFGMPIGEMWNLEQLAEDCAADRRYDFFLTSAPLNV